MTTAERKGVTISEELARRVNAARDEGKPIAVAYVAPDGFPVLSLRGSIHVHDEGTLALWARHADGDFVRSISTNPRVAMLYRDNSDLTTFTFSGLARVEADEAVRDRVFSESPTAERDHDPDRRGAAVLVALEHIEGGTVGSKESQVFSRSDEAKDVWSALYAPRSQR